MYYILDGKKIRELMEQQNMNVSKLSELSGVSQSCIRNILNEKSNEYKNQHCNASGRSIKYGY